MTDIPSRHIFHMENLAKIKYYTGITGMFRIIRNYQHDQATSNISKVRGVYLP